MPINKKIANCSMLFGEYFIYFNIANINTFEQEKSWTIEDIGALLFEDKSDIVAFIMILYAF